MKKTTLLWAISITVIIGTLAFSGENSPTEIKYYISILGGALITFISAMIGFDGVRFFTIKSTLGKALLLISLGILFWGLGNVMWFYYNVFAQIDVPYPSLADFGYLSMIPLAGLGLFLIIRSINFRFDAATILKLVIPPIAVTVICYFLFVQSKIAENVDLFTKFLNIMYPVGDIMFLSLALVILSISLGGVIFKPLAIMCLGFIFEATADFLFSYYTTLGTYYTGHWVDTLWALAFLLMGISMSEITKSHKSFIDEKA